MSYWLTYTEDDDLSSLAHQDMLDSQFEEQWHREYDQWLDLFGPWWTQLDSDQEDVCPRV